LPEGLMLNSWLIAARTNVELDSNSRFIEAAVGLIRFSGQVNYVVSSVRRSSL